MPFENVLSRLMHKSDLTPEEMAGAVESIMSGALKTPDIESFLRLLREKGETPDEIAAAVKVMRKHSLRFSREYPEALDTCGTGGDAKNTLNVSTLAALLACAAGVTVAKHGNRSVSSLCGSADLLEMLGVRIALSPQGAEACLNETGFAFLFAPHFHPAVKHAMEARKNIQGKTLFNLLGPLTNPAGVKHQLLGVYSRELVETMAGVLQRLGMERGMVVHGSDGMDEISLSDSTYTAMIESGQIHTAFLAPEAVSLSRRKIAEISCSTKAENKRMAEDVMSGAPGAPLDIVCLNAAAAIHVAGKAASFIEGYKIARETAASGKIKEKLSQIVKVSNSLS